MRPYWLALLCFAAVGAIVLTFFVIRVRPAERPAADANSQIPTPLSLPTVTFVNPVRGVAGAAVTVVQFSDFQCAACAQLAKNLSSLLSSRADVRVVWKDLPDEGAHPMAVPAAVAAHCADRQGEFWEYHDALFARQAALSPETFTRIAGDLELDTTAFQGCVDAQDTLAIVRKDFDEARALGLTSTPTLFVGDTKAVGAPSLDELNRYVEDAAR